jgi:arylformamidase
MRKIIDISQTIRPGIATWPGDTEYRRFWMMKIADGDSCNVGSITMSLHTGTHADAPYHFLEEGESIGEVDLSAYIGRALVVDMIDVEEINADRITDLKPEGVERILFRTLTAEADRFRPPFAHLTAGGANALVEAGVKLIGIDTPSVDEADSRTLDAHKILAAHNIAILENLNLQNAEPGEYELIALPLKLAGMDGSPVRAVLRTEM